MLEIVQQVVDQIALVVRFISMFAILAGVMILASSVAGTRFRRIREVVILKTLGATRQRVAGIFSVEFSGAGRGGGPDGERCWPRRFRPCCSSAGWMPISASIPCPTLICIVLTALVANAAGWMASFRILGRSRSKCCGRSRSKMYTCPNFCLSQQLVLLILGLDNRAGATRKSPHDHFLEWGGRTITITYGRPYSRGQKMIGDHEPYGEVACGADEATTLETDADLDINGLKEPEGNLLFSSPYRSRIPGR